MIAPDGSTLYAITDDGTLTALELPAGTPRASTSSGLGTLTGSPLAAISPDGKAAIFGSQSALSGELHQIDLQTMTAEGSATIVSGETFAETAAFTPDGQYLMVGLNTTNRGVAKVRISDLTLMGTPLDLLGAGASFLHGVVLSPDGATGYVVDENAVVRFDVATMTITGEVRFPTTLSIQGGTLMRSPDGSRLYFVGIDGSTPVLHTIDLATMRMLETRTVADLPAPSAEFWGVLAPDGTTVFVGNNAGDAVRVPVATPHPLDVTVTSRGSVAMPSGGTCSTRCIQTLLDYETVTLTATAEPGATFTGWGGACAGSETTCTLTMDQARSVTASFGDDPAPLRLTIRSTKAQVAGTRIVFTTRLRVSEAGTISQRIVLRPQTGTRAARVVCRVTRTVTRAGTTTVLCRSTPAARRMLERRSLRVSVITTLRADDGRTRQATRHLRLVRTGPKPAPPVTG
jgi:hypothetical protein